MTDELKHLIEMYSSSAENIFKQHKAIPPIWVYANEDGDLNMFSPPDNLTMIRELFKRDKAVLCLFIDEAWMAITDDLNDATPPSERLDREEVIVFAGEDADGAVLAMRHIVRPATGAPYLSPLKWVGNICDGRYIDMLPCLRTLH
jgi:hypothetical protein